MIKTVFLHRATIISATLGIIVSLSDLVRQLWAWRSKQICYYLIRFLSDWQKHCCFCCFLSSSEMILVKFHAPKIPCCCLLMANSFHNFFCLFVLSPFLVLLKMHIIVILCVILHLQGHCKNSNEEKNEWWYEINRNEMRKLISFFLPWGKIVIYSLQYVRSFYKISPVFLKDSLTSNF